MQPSGSLFSRTHALPSGPRVRLRMARASDLAPVGSLLRGRGVEATDLELSRILHFNPATRFVICAYAIVDGRDTLVGFGAIDLTEHAEPDTLVADERLTQGLGELLGAALHDQAASRARRVA